MGVRDHDSASPSTRRFFNKMPDDIYHISIGGLWLQC